MLNTENLKTPVLLLDESRCRTNIRNMTLKAKRSGVVFRPHFKTHQSATIGEWFRDEGVHRITVSSVRMAEYFSKAGWRDITVAFPFNLRETEDVNRVLSAGVHLNLLVDSAAAAKHLSKHLASETGIFIEIDTGDHRSGIHFEDIERLEQTTEELQKAEKLVFKGFLTHDGHTYRAGNRGQIMEIHSTTVFRLRNLRNRYHPKKGNVMISVGDTPACSLADAFTGMDEVRPGNFVFYDLMQENLGVCNEHDIAVCLAVPVVSVDASNNRIVVYGGAVHLSKEALAYPRGQKEYGRIVKLSEIGWSGSVKEAHLASLSQEHGIVNASQQLVRSLKPGDMIGILPVHSCLTADLSPCYLTLENKRIDKMHLS